MKIPYFSSTRRTLKRTFGQRLLLLGVLFLLLVFALVTLVYQRETERMNRSELSENLAHMAPRIHNQQRLWDEDADHLLSIIKWSGLVSVDGEEREQKLRAFFVAQSESMGFEGMVLTDASSGQLVFDYWNHAEMPHLVAAIAGNSGFWVDEEHSVLYSRTVKSLHIPGQAFNAYFFRAWDSSTLNRLSFSGSTSFITLGSHPLLSSAGSLELELMQPSDLPFRSYSVGDIHYQEGSTPLSDITLANGNSIPLKLVVRQTQHNFLLLSQVLLISFGMTLLFGLLLFAVMGRWMGALGLRLDLLNRATTRFHEMGKTVEGDEILLAAIDGKKDQISAISQELSELIVTASKREEEQAAYLQTLSLLQDAVIEFSTDGCIQRASDAWKALSGQDEIGRSLLTSFIHPEDNHDVLEQISALSLNQKQQVNIRFRLHRQDDIGAHVWVEGRFAAVKINGKVSCVRGVVRDITSTYLQERQISHMALHDALTDLPNRVLLEDRLNMAISRAARANNCVALGFIDLDHFKQVNDNFGHKMGDRLLKEVTQRLQSALRSTDTLSRWGGDEFVVLCPDLISLEDARDITQKLALLTQENILIDGTEFPFTFSGGFAVYPDDASNGETLLSQADRAMFYAKAQGRNNIQFFNAIAAKDPGRKSFYIQSRLTTAIHGNQIEAWLQPLISAKTGDVIGAEVLARWQEADQGWIPPSVFIPMAESMGLIDLLGQSVWKQSMNAFPLLPAGHRLSINLSKRQLFSSTIVEQFCADVAAAKIKPEQIMLEITEGIALSDVEYAHERIAELDAQGFGIAVDDFGVGYSSLSQLHEVPADELKLDISFVRRIHEKTGFSMSSAIISIAKSLNMEIVAEGVEDEKTAKLLTEMDVDVLQGYYFAKPMPIDEYLVWIEKRKRGLK